MKISAQKIFNSITKVFSHSRSLRMTSELEKSPLRDVVELQSKTLERNTLSFKQNYTLGFKTGYIIKDLKKKIGYVDYDILSNRFGVKNEYPADWFIENAKPNKNGLYPLKPFMYINEISMNDRIGKKNLVKRDKKYGTMAMQKLLEISESQGSQSRIAVLADTLGNTAFKPGKFYSKMGFSLSPKRIERLAKEEELLNISHNKIDNRYTEESGYMFLTNPECIINYNI